MRQPDEWKDPWLRSKSPRRRPGLGSPPRSRRHHRASGSSVSLSNSSRLAALPSNQDIFCDIGAEKHVTFVMLATVRARSTKFLGCLSVHPSFRAIFRLQNLRNTLHCVHDISNLGTYSKSTWTGGAHDILGFFPHLCLTHIAEVNIN